MSTDPDHDCLFLLHDVARLIRTRADQLARGTMGMTRAQWIILSRLERTPGLSQNELAGVLEVEPITVGRLVDKLEARGLVKRSPDPKDRRVWRLTLMAKAAPILKEIAIHRDELRDMLIAGIEPPMLDVLTQALLKIKSNLTAEESAAVAAR
jgi:MarR family transcriptional regulator for hemolysin